MYRKEAHKVSYKIFDINQLINALGEQNLVTFHPEVLFSGEKQYQSKPTQVLTAEEEIEQAKQRGKRQFTRQEDSLQSHPLLLDMGKEGQPVKWN